MDSDELFNFDRSQIGQWDEEHARRLLSEQPELYRNHLRIANSIDVYVARSDESPYGDPKWFEGFTRAFREVAAWLRKGDFVEGGKGFSDLDQGGDGGE
jgi:hypothetical protein